MRKLLLFRHGKSDWDADFGDDHQRPLAGRGRKAARRVGRFLARAGEAPQAALTSSALRARSTVELAAEAGGWRCPVEVTSSLYDASPQDVLAVVRRQPAAVASLLVVGHEPTLSALGSLLVGGGRLRFPTATVACIGFEAETWAEVEGGRGELLWLVTPRLLKRAGP